MCTTLEADYVRKVLRAEMSLLRKDVLRFLQRPKVAG
jgi:hypothetical protein